ncbi:MAG: hypothetical protein J0H89_08295 [Rhizobiales bacterium]|jgi:hypothetical protein|nr:hypothetical protein [Hyphomicrobiales bacterium]
MSRSDDTHPQFASLASDLAAACAEAIEQDRLDSIPDDSMGQALGALVRLYAAKAQMGNAPRPFGRNSGVTVTDVAIGCTALLESVGLEVFELGAWHAMSGIGRITPTSSDNR